VTRALFVSLRRVAAAPVVLSVVLGATTATAAEPERTDKVGLAVDACSAAFDASLRRILRIELGGLLDDGSAPNTPPGREWIEIRCESELARVTAHDARGERDVRNDLSYDAFPGDAAPRAVALAALEALRAVDPTLAERIEAERAKQPPPEPAAAEVVAPKAEPKPPAKSPEPDRAPMFMRVLLGGTARFYFGDAQTTAAGLRSELSFRFGIPLDLGFDLEGSLARSRVVLGSVEARMLSLGAWVGPRAGNDVWSATVALGGRIGVAGLSGSATPPGARAHDVTRAAGGPMLVLRGDGAVGSFAFALVLENGYAVVGAEGLSGGAAAIGFDGAWLAVSANAGVRW
jgi:hypothetical protein